MDVGCSREFAHALCEQVTVDVLKAQATEWIECTRQRCQINVGRKPFEQSRKEGGATQLILR